MKSRLLLLVAFLATANCTDSTSKIAEEESVKIFTRRIGEEGELTFESWNGILQGVDSESILHFRKESKVELEDRGIGIQFFSGSYSLEPSGRVTVNLEGYHWNWPVMILRRDGGNLVLYREDGVTTWPIEASSPNASREGFWPFRASKKDQTEDANGILRN